MRPAGNSGSPLRSWRSSLLLAATAAWAAGRLQEHTEANAAEARLASSLRAANGGVRSELRPQRRRKPERFRSPRTSNERFSARPEAPCDCSSHGGDNVAFVLPNGRGRRGAIALRRAVEVSDAGGRQLGRVVVGVPLDQALINRLDAAAGVPGGRRTRHLRERSLPHSAAGDRRPTLDVDAARLGDRSATRRVCAEPAHRRRDLGHETSSVLRALLTLALIALAWWSATRFLASRAAPAPAPRRRAHDLDPDSTGRRAREAVALVGEALAATHDPDALLPVIVESAVGATGAVGARLVSDGAERFRAGHPESGGPPLSVSLGTDDEHVGSLLIYPERGRPFNEDEGRLAHWLAAQASIALENARLHRAVEQQAITDDLTGLANRRRFRESLGLEVSRAERFGGSLALVLADLDDFKRVNDLYGHQVGDDVLRRFADLMRESVREFDLAVRHGGEEFAVLVPETDPEGGARLAERLAEALREHAIHESHRRVVLGHRELRRGSLSGRGLGGATDARGRPRPLSREEGREKSRNSRGLVSGRPRRRPPGLL